MNTNQTKPQKSEKLLDTEIRRATYKKLSRLTKGPRDSGLSKALCPNEDDNDVTDEITDPEQLFDRLIQCNKKHLSQANESYLAQPPHSETLPPFHYSPVVHEILKGNLNSFDSLPPELKSLLTEMKALDSPHTINPIMTITNFREGMKKVPEGKSSSLSGRNYSIYKAMLPGNYFTGKVVELIGKLSNSSTKASHTDLYSNAGALCSNMIEDHTDKAIGLG